MQPLTIVELAPQARSTIVMSGAPGVFVGADGALGLCEETLIGEMLRLRDHKVDLLIGLIEDEELGSVAYEDIAEAATRVGIEVMRLPLRDFRGPNTVQSELWEGMMDRAVSSFQNGHSIALHCLAGIGRSGMMAACLLVRLGASPQDALERIRALQPEALETEEQVAYLLSQRPGTVSRV